MRGSRNLNERVLNMPVCGECSKRARVVHGKDGAVSACCLAPLLASENPQFVQWVQELADISTVNGYEDITRDLTTFQMKIYWNNGFSPETALTAIKLLQVHENPEVTDG